jgi:hypothetical protein
MSEFNVHGLQDETPAAVQWSFMSSHTHPLVLRLHVTFVALRFNIQMIETETAALRANTIEISFDCFDVRSIIYYVTANWHKILNCTAILVS